MHSFIVKSVTSGVLASSVVTAIHFEESVYAQVSHDIGEPHTHEYYDKYGRKLDGLEGELLNDEQWEDQYTFSDADVESVGIDIFETI